MQLALQERGGDTLVLAGKLPGCIEQRVGGDSPGARPRRRPDQVSNLQFLPVCFFWLPQKYTSLSISDRRHSSPGDAWAWRLGRHEQHISLPQELFGAGAVQDRAGIDL